MTDTAARRRCDQELCPNWSGDGNVCPCAVLDLPRREPNAEPEWWHDY